MQHNVESENRKVLPRWRAVSRIPAAELFTARPKGLPEPSFVGGIEAAKERYDKDGSLESAVELLTAAKTFGDLETFSTIKKEIEPMVHELRPSVRAYLFSDATGSAASEVIDIRTAKSALRSYPRNAVLRSQLALAYANKGQKRRAREEMTLASALAPKNRLVYRSAVRCFVHLGEPDRALAILPNNGETDDPWIESALLAAGDLLGDLRRISIRRIRRMLSNDYHPTQLVELAIGLATLEVESGNLKSARKIINRYRSSLNENAAAQVRWIEENYRTNLGLDLNAIFGSYEAAAMLAHAEGQWQVAYNAAESWKADEPFAPRPAILASYIAAAYLEDFQKAVAAADAGLIANPNDFTLLNNKAYGLSEMGRLVEAKAVLERARQLHPSGTDYVVALATAAHIQLRSGKTDAGVMGYIEAAQYAADNRLVGIRDHLLVHFMRELTRMGVGQSHPFMQQLRAYFKDGGATDEAQKLFEHVYAKTSVEPKELVLDLSQVPFDLISKH